MKDAENDFIEIEQYVKIIEYFESEEDPNSREIFRDMNLIHLMDELEQDKETQDVVKNSIIIMNALIDLDYPPDMYNMMGLSSEDLTDEQKAALKANLKAEE